jgi:four helix bundle protein
MIKSYRDLVVWQKAMELVTEVYRVTKKFPKDELFGLTGQMRRAAVAVPSNIAEGYGKSSRKEYIYFLTHARGSLLELETQVLIASNLSYLKESETDDLLSLVSEVGRIIHGLLSSLKTPKHK